MIAVSSMRHVAVTLLLASCAACASTESPAPRPPALPDTPAARQFGAWLEPFNVGDMERVDSFLSGAYLANPPHSGAFDQFRVQTGGFHVLEIVSSSDTQLVAMVKERDWDTYARVTMEVEAEPPHHITTFGLRAEPYEGAPPIARLSERRLVAALRDKMEAASEAGDFAGAVVLARDGEPMFTYVNGDADRENHVPITLETKFRNGSMNKMFTAVSILQLVEDGRIDLDAPIGTYLADYPNQDLAQRVTVRHLLTHTGGTGDIFTHEYFEHIQEVRTHSDYLALFGERDVSFEPGDHFEYSNYGFILLGAIVEAVTGESYYDYVDAHVFAPAGMTSTGALPEEVEVPGRAVGYTYSEGDLVDAADTFPYRGTSAGGGYSTVGDFVRFAEALQAGVLISPGMVEAATTTQVDALARGGYGYGFTESFVNGARSWGHGGSAPGMRGNLRVFPESGYTLAVASNMDSATAQRLVEWLGARLPLDAAAR